MDTQHLYILPILLSSAIAKNHSKIKLFALSTQVLFSLSHVNVGMVHEARPLRWIITFHYCQLMSSPAPALLTDFSQPLSYHFRIWYDPPLGNLHFRGVGNNPVPLTCFKDLCLWPGRMTLQLLSSPVTWSDGERQSVLEMKVYAKWRSKTPMENIFLSMEKWQGKTKARA